MAASRSRFNSTSGDVSLLVCTDSILNSFSGSRDSVFESDYSYDPQQEGEDKDKIRPILAHRRNKSGSRSIKGSLSLSHSTLETESFVEELEKYVKEMARTDNSSVDDAWAQLHQKEADLLLAAELGNALLEKNQELEKEQKKLVDQFSTKLEALEQENHILRRKLQTNEEESEAQVVELQSDVRDLTAKLDQRENTVKQSDREKTSLITELTAQNTRLTNQLKDASAQEILLTSQLQGLRDQNSMRKTSLQDHISSMETLREEVHILLDQKTELEKRLQAAFNERDSMSSQLEEATDRTMLLERHVREQEMKYKKSVTDVERLQRENTTLTERVGGPMGNIASNGNMGLKRSLQAEMDGGNGPDGMIPGPALHAEALHVYRQLRALCQHLRSTHDDDSGLQSDLSIEPMEGSEQVTLKAGVLAEVAEDLALIVADLEGVRFKDMLEKLSQKLHERDTDLQFKNEIILELESKLSVYEVELNSIREELESARADAAGGELARDGAVSEARAARDAAHARRTKAEAELARARVEQVQLGSQLLEAVRQKVELSQQLDQWQMDMQELIEEQMKHKLSSQERKRKVEDPKGAEPTRTNKILSFFQR